MYTCITCNYDTPDKSNLNKHMKSKSHMDKMNGINKDEIYKCDKCKYTSIYAQNMMRHKNTKHNGLIKKKYECLACNIYINDNRDLKYHKGSKEHRNNVYEKFPEAFKKIEGIMTGNLDLSKVHLYIKKVNKLIDKKMVNKLNILEYNIKKSKEKENREGLDLFFISYDLMRNNFKQLNIKFDEICNKLSPRKRLTMKEFFIKYYEDNLNNSNHKYMIRRMKKQYNDKFTQYFLSKYPKFKSEVEKHDLNDPDEEYNEFHESD